jgi:hypothetical protein
MVGFEPILIVTVAVLSIGAIVGVRFWRKRRRKKLADANFERARREFSKRREWLEADFIKQGSASGFPRGLRWVNCDFQDEVSFAWDRRTGDLKALVGVAIQFAAVEGGGMEDVAAVSNLKAATAVFQFHDQKWKPTGKTVFNLNPKETIRYYQNELELVDY